MLRINSSLKIKSGEIIGDNISFSLPADFYLESYTDNNLQLISSNGLTEIKIKCEKSELTTEERFDNFIEDTEAVQIGNYFNIKRGNGMATAVYCEYEKSQLYMERFTFKSNRYSENAILIIIETLGETIYEVLESPAVKNFIHSIRYC